jgi:hypothetical protein
MSGQVRLKVSICGFGLTGDILSDEVELLAYAPTNNRIVAIKAESQAFAIGRLFSNEILDETVKFLRRRRALPRARKKRRHVLDLSCGDHEHSAKNEKM